MQSACAARRWKASATASARRPSLLEPLVDVDRGDPRNAFDLAQRQRDRVRDTVVVGHHFLHQEVAAIEPAQRLAVTNQPTRQRSVTEEAVDRGQSTPVVAGTAAPPPLLTGPTAEVESIDQERKASETSAVSLLGLGTIRSATDQAYSELRDPIRGRAHVEH